MDDETRETIRTLAEAVIELGKGVGTLPAAPQAVNGGARAIAAANRVLRDLEATPTA
jgi:hypothetical protein